MTFPQLLDLVNDVCDIRDREEYALAAAQAHAALGRIH